MKKPWVKVGEFGKCEIYAFGNERVLFNPLTKKIELEYQISKFALHIVDLAQKGG
jgi:hypothetical protein